jgi:hypothetical protein
MHTLMKFNHAFRVFLNGDARMKLFFHERIVL